MENKRDIYGILNERGEREITLQKICNIIGVEVPERFAPIKDTVQNHVATRPEYAVDGCIFFRLTDLESEDYGLEGWLPYVKKRKFMAIFVDEEQYRREQMEGSKFPLIPVENIIEKAGIFFSYMKELNDVKTIAVTGTCGKTTTMKFLGSIVPDHFPTWMNKGNANSYMSVSRHIMEELKPEHEIYIQETGAASPDSIRKAAAMLRVDAFVLLNVFNHHINKYLTQENILKDKASFDDYMKDGGVVVANYDDDLIAGYKFKHDVITFGIETDREVDYRACNIHQDGAVLKLDIVHAGGTTHIETSILGTQNAYNALAAFALSKWLGLTDEQIKEGLESYVSMGFRQNFRHVGGYDLLLDCYNVCEDSLKADLKTVKEIRIGEGQKKVAVITGENKLGENAYDISFKLGTELDLADLQHVIVIGPKEESQENIDFYCHGRALYEGIKSTGYENVVYVTDPKGMEAELRKVMEVGDVILFKGMYNMDLTPVIDRVFGTTLAMNNPYYIKQAKQINRPSWKALKFPVLKAVDIVEAKKKGQANVKIPSRIGFAPVHRLKPGLFKNNKKLETLDLGKTIRNIGKGTFQNCTNLKEVIIPSSVNIIEARAFKGCSSLKKVVIEEGVTHIEAQAFNNCAALEEVVIPQSMKYIDKSAFTKCPKLDKKIIKL